MKLRATAALVAVSAVVTGLLVSTPAEAKSRPYDSYVKTRNVALSSSGTGKIFVTCAATKTCRGTVRFLGSTRTRSYAVPAKKSRYVTIAVRTGESAFPSAANGATDKGDYLALAATIRVNETGPRRKTHDYKVTTETTVARQSITGQVSGPGGVTKLKVELVKTYRGGNTKVVKTSKVSNGGYPGGNDYNLDVSLGTNNSASSPFRLRITGIDRAGNFRSWFFRSTTGGQRYVRDSTVVRASKAGNYIANFKYQSIQGRVTDSPDDDISVSVSAVPAQFTSSSTTSREYDIPYCADTFGTVRTDSAGGYEVDFLPYSDNISTTVRYMVSAKVADRGVFAGADGTRYGSCHDVTDYTHSRKNLIPLTASGLFNKNISLAASGISLNVRGKASGFSPTSRGDRFVRLREKVPGLTVLQSPVVYEGQAESNMDRLFTNVEPGKYWAEIGRRTGCSTWVPSRFSNNNTYFTGGDRSSDRWRTVAGKFPESGISTANGYIPRTPPRGYKGWMFRGVCGANGAGVYATVNVTSTKTFDLPTDKRGATVSGKVTRSRGGTRAEMMVRLSSADGKRVLRTAITSGSGAFKVTGLASGNYLVSVNSDSWRGSGRKFSGRHTIRVTAGKSYSVGTLRYTD